MKTFETLFAIGSLAVLSAVSVSSQAQPAMVFDVKDKSMLDNVKAGDKLRFNVVNDSGKMVVSEIQAAK